MRFLFLLTFFTGSAVIVAGFSSGKLCYLTLSLPKCASPWHQANFMDRWSMVVAFSTAAMVQIFIGWLHGYVPNGADFQGTGVFYTIIL